MRIVFTIVILSILFISCKKDKYTTAPQITFKSISPDVVTQDPNQTFPVLKLGITDSEGDVGFKSGKDTAFVYIVNKLFPTQLDSIPFPDIQSAGSHNFKADIDVSLKKFLRHNCTPPANVTDTIYFDIYVKDFAKNKSNVINTPDPVYYRCF